MPALRQRMIEDLQLRGMSERTQGMSVRTVRQLAEHYRTSPDCITEEELRQYFLSLNNVQHASRRATTIALCGIKFFYAYTLHRPWPTLTFVRPPQEHTLPVILSRDGVRTILQRVRLPRYRVCLSTLYACGLRLQEGTHVQVPDIARARMVIHVRCGTGAQDRYATHLLEAGVHLRLSTSPTSVVRVKFNPALSVAASSTKGRSAGAPRRRGLKGWSAQYTLPEMGKTSADTAHRDGVAERCPAPAVPKSGAVALARMDCQDQ